MTATGERLFRTAHAGLRWRQWGDELVVFDSGTAETHCLAEPRASVFRALAESVDAMTLDAIAAAFDDDASEGGQTLSADERAAVDAMLSELVSLGLVRSSP